MPSDMQAILQKLQQYINAYGVGGGPGNNPGVANDLRVFLATGKPPATPQAMAVLNQVLAETPYAGNPAAFHQAYSGGGAGQGGIAEAVQAGTPPAPAAGNTMPIGAGPDQGGDQPGLNSGTGQGLTLAQRVAQAAQQGASGTPSPGRVVQGAPNQLAGGGGIGQGQDNGVGGGGPQGQAAAIAAARRAAAEAAMPANAGQQAPGAPGALPGMPTAGQGTGSSFTPAQGMDLSTDDDRLIRFALQQAGLNPDRMTSFTKNVGRQLVPLLRSARSAYGITNNAAVDKMPDFFSQLAKSLTSAGGGFFGQLRDLGENTMNSEAFKTYLSGISNPEDQAAMIQSLMPSRYAGSNPLIQQSAADTYDRTLNQFKDTVFNNSGAVPAGGVFMDWLAQQGQQLDPVTRRIFGIR